MSDGTTLLFVGASISFMNGTFTRLKKYSSPTQVMPATKWIQRSAICSIAEKSLGALKGKALRSSATACMIPPAVRPPEAGHGGYEAGKLGASWHDWHGLANSLSG